MPALVENMLQRRGPVTPFPAPSALCFCAKGEKMH